MLQTGGEFYLHNSRLVMDDFYSPFRVFDREEYLSTGIEEWYWETFYDYDNRDRYTISYLNVPLMLGFQNKKYYFLAGAKVGFDLQTKSQTTAILRNTGLYDYSIEEIENIPGRFFTRQERGRVHDLRLGFNTTASAEMGFYLGDQSSSSNVRYRLALFADYGLMNINTHKPKEDIMLYAPDFFYRPELNSFVKSYFFEGRKMNTFYVGLKFTVVFGIRERQNCLWSLCP
jgi:hypothetical protein